MYGRALLRNVKFLLQVDDVQCIIDDGSQESCESFIARATADMCQNEVDILFTYTFTNIGLACVRITNVEADFSPFGKAGLTFNDMDLCEDESMSVDDKRTTTSLCDESYWDIAIGVSDEKGRTNSLAYQYILPSSAVPSSTPTTTSPPTTDIEDDCIGDCTLTSMFTASKCVHTCVTQCMM